MKVIGEKIKITNLFFYILIPSLIILVTVIILIMINGFSIVKVLVGSLGGYSFGVGIYLALIPKDLIAIDNDNVILLRKNKIIKISEIIKVKSIRASNDMLLFLFGSLIIETKNGRIYREYYLSNPRHVAREINNIINISSDSHNI